MKIIKLIENLSSDSSSESEDPKHYVPWSPEETIYLIVGVIKYGRKWQKILNCFREKFHQSRNRGSLLDRFQVITSESNIGYLDIIYREAHKVNDSLSTLN